MMPLNKSYILMLMLWVLWACTPDVPMPDVEQTPVLETVAIRGLVCDGGGQPLQGVVVSDCYESVITDAKGVFELDSDLEKVKFVYVSIPSGYTVPTMEYLCSTSACRKKWLLILAMYWNLFSTRCRLTLTDIRS